MKGSYLVNGRPSTQRLNDKPTISFHDLCTACCAQRAYARSQGEWAYLDFGWGKAKYGLEPF